MNNFFHSLFKSKLDAMRAAAPRATLHMLHESNGFSVYLDEAAAAQKVSTIGVLTDHAEDILEDPSVLHLFVPLEQAVKFVEEVTVTHSVALVDVILATKVHAARYVMYAYFPRRTAPAAHVSDLQNRLACHDGCSRWGVEDVMLLQGMHDKTEPPSWAKPLEKINGGEVFIRHPKIPEFLAPVAALPEKMSQAEIDEEYRRAAPVAEKEADDDFWG